MRKLWIRRRAVSTMIAGVIVLTLFLVALTAMIVLTQQYDSYQQTVIDMNQADMERFSENLGFDPPLLVNYTGNPVSCGVTTCNEYTIIVNDFSGNGSVDVGAEIAQIYINSSQVNSRSGCINLCILSPSTTPSPYTFSASQRYVDPGEFEHNVTLWLPSSIVLPATDSQGNPSYAQNTVTVVTTRGRQFSFQWPLPPAGFPAGAVSGGAGGTGLYIGPLVITFQKTLLAYSINSSTVFDPIGGTNGYWVLPPPNLVIYVKIQTDRGTPSNVYVTAQSILELVPYGSPGHTEGFFIVAPISLKLCAKFMAQDPTIICDPSYGYYSSGNQGDPGNLTAYKPCTSTPYSSCPNRYMIPAPTTTQLLNNERGNPVIIAFAAAAPYPSTKPQTGGGYLGSGTFTTSFLGLTFVYNDQTGSGGDYTYAVTLPFMAVCFGNSYLACGT